MVWYLARHWTRFELGCRSVESSQSQSYVEMDKPNLFSNVAIVEKACSWVLIILMISQDHSPSSYYSCSDYYLVASLGFCIFLQAIWKVSMSIASRCCACLGCVVRVIDTQCLLGQDLFCSWWSVWSRSEFRKKSNSHYISRKAGIQ